MELQIAKNGQHMQCQKRLPNHSFIKPMHAYGVFSSLAGAVRGSSLVRDSAWCCGIPSLWYWLSLCSAGTMAALLFNSLDFFPGQAGELPALGMPTAGNSSDWQLQYWQRIKATRRRRLQVQTWLGEWRLSCLGLSIASWLSLPTTSKRPCSAQKLLMVLTNKCLYS